MCVCVCVCVFVYTHMHTHAQSCPTLCDPRDCSLPGSSVHGIFQARILEQIVISSSKGSCPPRDQTCVSCVCVLHWMRDSLPVVLDIIQNREHYPFKDTIVKGKGLKEWMKFTSNHIPHKRFVSGICKEQLKCNDKKINSTILK